MGTGKPLQGQLVAMETVEHITCTTNEISSHKIPTSWTVIYYNVWCLLKYFRLEKLPDGTQQVSLEYPNSRTECCTIIPRVCSIRVT